MNHSFRSTWAPRLLIAAVATAVALSAGSVLATTNAKGESAHLSLGIVGKDVVTSSGKARLMSRWLGVYSKLSTNAKYLGC